MKLETLPFAYKRDYVKGLRRVFPSITSLPRTLNLSMVVILLRKQATDAGRRTPPEDPSPKGGDGPSGNGPQ